MSKILIMTDSASDISVEQERDYNIKVLPFMVVLNEQTYVSRVDIDNEGFYKMMAENKEIPKTSQITAFGFYEAYEQAYKDGYTDVISVLINASGSATYQNSLMAMDDFYEEYPDAKDKIHFYSHDSASYSGAYGEVAVNAAKMVLEDKTVEEINTYISNTIPKRRIYFGIYELTYAGKSGRIPSAAAFLGDKLGIKPIMKIWDHEITTAAKCRGDKKVIAKIVEQTLADMEPGSPYQVVYGNDESVRDDIIKRMEKEVGYGPTACYQIGAAVAANAGPKVTGTIFNVK